MFEIHHPSDEDFVHTLECNAITGVDFGRRDVKIANKVYGFSDAMGKMKHSRKGKKMEQIITRTFIWILICYSSIE